MKQKFFQLVAAVLVLCLHVPSWSEDTDLFVGVPPSTTEVPNVLIIMDNTANWNDAFVNEKAALVSVFNGMPTDKFRVGLMMFTETGGGNSGNDGAYVRAGARLITSSNKSLYAAQINALDKADDKSNGGKVAKSMEEAYLYLTGGVPHAGNSKEKTDYRGNTAGNASDDAVMALTGNPLATKTSTTYVKPTGSSTVNCIKNYIIYISNGPAQDNSSDISQANSALTAAGGTTTQIALNPSGSQDNPADEWARFLKKSALKASVYTIDVDKTTSGQGPGWTALLKSMANQSSGRYFDVSSSGSGIQDAINTILSEVLSVNSVFASVSLPVSVNTQGTYLNQVFIGMFRPDGDAAPRWLGNLKQYKMALVNGDLQLVDGDGSTATNSQTGFVTECARSYWTPSTTDTEWSQGGESDCLTVPGAAASNYPDGNQVGKGGQAYKVRHQTTRTSLTCNSSACASSVAFNSTNVSAAMLGVSTTADRDDLINWAKGTDNYEDEDLDGSSTDKRLSTHGDVVHSRPVAVNFGTAQAPKVVVFYGANDGWFRAVNGNRSDAIGSYAAGEELWSFMPAEFLTKLDRLRKRTPLIYYPNTPASTSAVKDYGMDGPITAYQGTTSSGSTTKTFIYATMRRGGRSIYAFDVTDTLTSPNSPTFKWRVGCQSSDDLTCTSGMSGMGQSWSPIKTFKHGNYNSGNKPLMIFGGGYDTCEDYDNGTVNHNCTSTSKGHYVYVLDADTGAVQATLDTGGTRGIVADVALINDASGYPQYGYVPDLGGNVYRINFTGAPSAWTITKIASLGCSTTGSCDANRKFMFPPSVVKTASGEYSVLLGSGDREKPILNSSVSTPVFTASAAVSNYFFEFLDKPADASYPGTTDCGSAVICLGSLYSIGRTATSVDSAALALKKGWYLGMNTTEQVVTTALTVFSVVSFSTHEPANQAASPSGATTCTNLGTTRVYNVGLTDAASKNGTDARYEDVAGDGLPPSGVAGLVTLDNTGEGGNNGQTVPFIFGRKPTSVDPDLPTNSSGGLMPRNRLYWFIDKQ